MADDDPSSTSNSNTQVNPYGASLFGYVGSQVIGTANGAIGKGPKGNPDLISLFGQTAIAKQLGGGGGSDWTTSVLRGAVGGAYKQKDTTVDNVIAQYNTWTQQYNQQSQQYQAYLNLMQQSPGRSATVFASNNPDKQALGIPSAGKTVLG